MAPEESSDVPIRSDDAQPDGDLETDRSSESDAVAETRSVADDSSSSALEDDRDGRVSVADELDIAGGRVVVVGYDAWTVPVVEELRTLDCHVTVIVTDEAALETLRERGIEAVRTDDIDEACFRAAGLDAADAVFLPTLDEQQNVLAVLTVMNTDQSVHIATFAGEAGDVAKLRAAGADTVISLGQVVGELLVEVALTDRSVDEVVDELTARV